MADIKKDVILYIDDEPENLQGLEFILKKDYEILTAQSAEEGLEILSNNPVKVVITDQRMPEITGIEFLKKVIIKFPEVVRIIVTAYSDTETVIQAINEGKVYHFITKPWNVNELKVIIKNAIEAHNLRKDNEMLIGHLQKVNHDLLLAKERAEESDRLKSSFLSNMTHEIRTPLNAIIGFANLLTNTEIATEMRGSFVRIIENSSSDLLSIIEDILDTSKIEVGYVTLHESEFNLNKFMCEIYTVFQTSEQLKDKPVQLQYNYPKAIDKLVICTDMLRLKQIISNLVYNAIKFTDEGVIEFGYKLFDTTSKPVIEFYVKDTGIGIPADKFDFIFERFRKIENEKNRLFRGNGLGLFISKKLVELMGGSIRVESEIDNGSTFYFTIPYKPNTDIIEVKENPVHHTKEKIWPGKTLLIVEDEKSNYLYMKALLNNKIELIWVTNGLDAIKVCDEYKIDLILMDIQLPKMNGFDATRIIKEKHKNIPIIAVTAFAMDVDKTRCIEAGCDNYIAKPFKKDELFSLINTYVAEHGSQL